MSITTGTRPKYITNGSQLLETYDEWSGNYQCLDAITEEIVMVKADVVGEKGQNGKTWWPVIPSADV